MTEKRFGMTKKKFEITKERSGSLKNVRDGRKKVLSNEFGVQEVSCGLWRIIGKSRAARPLESKIQNQESKIP
jgi:hypothetical protein